MINIPLFIAIQGNPISEREKNIELFKYSYIYLKDKFNFNNIYVISDTPEILDIAKELGFSNFYLDKHTMESNYDIDIIGPYHCIKELNINCDWFINFRINQPFKGTKILRDCINAINDHYNLIATYSTIKDRSLYFIDDYDHWMNPSDYRLNKYCPKVKMVDSSIYCHKTSHFMKTVENKTFEKEIWKEGNFRLVENKAMFLPIFGIEQVKQLDIAEEAFLEVGKLKHIK